jgi:predicted nucleotidyltransferase
MVYSIDEIRTCITPVLKECNVKSAVLFGSYSRGEADEDSDIDLLVDSGLRGLRFVGLIGYIRDALQKEVDVFDVTQLKPGSRRELAIKQSGVRIYG